MSAQYIYPRSVLRAATLIITSLALCAGYLLLRRHGIGWNDNHELHGGFAYASDGGEISEGESGRPRNGRLVQPWVRNLAIAEIHPDALIRTRNRKPV